MTEESTDQATPEAQDPAPEQSPLARVSGKPVVDLPKDLYIPPDALAVFLEAFEGPLEEVDPRAELIRRLQQYERFKQAAEDIDELPRLERDTFAASAALPKMPSSQPHPDVDLREMLLALQGVLQRADLFTSHHVERERLSTRERMSAILSVLQDDHFVTFESLFTIEEGRLGVVVTFLATLELVKEQLIEVVQAEVLGPIHVRARAAS